MSSGARTSGGGWGGGLALAFLALASATAFAWMPRGGFWINDNGLKFIQVDGLVRSGLSRLAIAWPGRAIDPELAFGPFTEGFFHVDAAGGLHAAYSPVFALLSAPFYAALGAAGLYVLPLAGFLASLFAVRALGRVVAVPGQEERVATLAVLAAGLATPLFWYGQTFWEHAPAVAFSCFGLLACVRYRQAPNVRDAVRVGAFMALAAWFRTDAYLFGAVVLTGAWLGARRRVRDAGVLGASFALTLAPVWLFHLAAFGDPLGPHLASQPGFELGLAGWLASRAQTASNLLVRAHRDGGWSALVFLPFLLVLLLRPVLRDDRLRRATPVAAAAACAAGCVVLAGHLSALQPMSWLMVSNGLFASSPVCILGLLHAVRDPVDSSPSGETSHRARRALFAISVAYALLFAALVPEVNSRGIHWGNRFLLPLYPVLAVLAAAVACSWWERFGRGGAAVGTVTGSLLGKGALCAVLAVSVALQLYALVLLHDRRAFTSALNERVAGSGFDVVVTDTWFLPVDLAPVFYDKQVFFVHRGERGRFRELARAHGLDRALSIERTGVGAGSAEPAALDDGWLGFSPVRFQEVRLSRQAQGAAPRR